MSILVLAESYFNSVLFCSVHFVVIKTRIFSNFDKKKSQVELCRRISRLFRCIEIRAYICIYHYCLYCNATIDKETYLPVIKICFLFYFRDM